MKLPPSVEYYLRRKFIPYGSRPWLYFGIAMFAFRIAKRFAGTNPKPLVSFRVKDGETYQIRGVTRAR
jgi:hypothetical protein